MLQHCEALATELQTAERAVAGRSGLRHLTVEGRPPLASQLFDRGRLCWATCERHAGRLTEILARSTQLSAADLEALVQECRRDNLRLGEELVSRKLVSPGTLRAALLRHIASATVGALRCLWEDGATWQPFVENRVGGYDPTFTFTTTEVLLEAIQLLTETGSGYRLPQNPFEDPTGELNPALCLLRMDSHQVPATRPFPVRVSDAERVGLLAINDLSQRLIANLEILGANRELPERILLRLESASWFCAYRAPYLACYQIRDSRQVALLQQRFG